MTVSELVEAADRWLVPIVGTVTQCRLDYAFSLVVADESAESCEVYIEHTFVVVGHDGPAKLLDHLELPARITVQRRPRGSSTRTRQGLNIRRRSRPTTPRRDKSSQPSSRTILQKKTAAKAERTLPRLAGGAPLGNGLTDASPGLRALHDEGSIARRSIIDIRATLTENGFARQTLTGPAGENDRVMRRDGQWDLRVQNRFGNYLDRFGDVGTPGYGA